MWPNPEETVDLFTFHQKILNGKPHFLCSEATVALPLAHSQETI